MKTIMENQFVLKNVLIMGVKSKPYESFTTKSGKVVPAGTKVIADCSINGGYVNLKASEEVAKKIGDKKNYETPKATFKISIFDSVLTVILVDIE